MKFLSLALAALVGLTDAKKIGSAEMNRRMQKNLVNKSVLMRGAKPLNDLAKRKLEEEEWEITGEYSIQFNHCTSMSVQNNEAIEDANLAEMAANGDLVSDKDFIVFNVCKTEYCEYYGEDEKMTFIAEVGTYFQAISQYLPNKVEEYCEACEENYDYCYAMSTGQTYYPEGYEPEEEEAEEENEEEGEEEGEEGEEEGDERRRKLKSKSRKLAQNQVIKFVDCQMCADYECLDFQQASSNGYYDEDGEYVEAELDDAMEWLNGFSECAETNAYMDNYQIYSNLMCNSAGTGLEIGLFMDDECTLYTPKLAYKDIMQSADITYYNMISDVVEFTFTNSGIECYNPEVVWYNEVDYYYEQMEKAQNGEEDEEEEEDDGEAPEAAEWCQELVQDDAAVDLYDCGGYEVEEDNNDDQNGDDYVSNYDWYSFELTEEQTDDIGAVCAVYTGMIAAANAEVDENTGGYSNYQPHTTFNPEHENLFNYETENSQSSGGKVFLWILIVAVVGGGAAAFFLQKSSSNDKKKPLINEAEGTMA